MNRLITIDEFISDLIKVSRKCGEDAGLTEIEIVELTYGAAFSIGNHPMEMGNVKAMDKNE